MRQKNFKIINSKFIKKLTINSINCNRFIKIINFIFFYLFLLQDNNFKKYFYCEEIKMKQDKIKRILMNKRFHY